MYQLELVFRLLVSPIHVFPIQHVLKHCGAHKHNYINIYTHVIQNNLKTPQLVGFARQLGYKNHNDTIQLSWPFDIMIYDNIILLPNPSAYIHVRIHVCAHVRGILIHCQGF